MIALSVVIITKNEAENICRCLDAVQGLADEIVVVDSGSTDETEALCSLYQARFLYHPFEGYKQQKNYALAQAKYPYVLSLDADEVLSPELFQSILAAKKNWTHDAYQMNRLNNYCGQWIRYCGWYPDRKIRLFDKRKAKWGIGEIHERVVLQKEAMMAKLSGDLLHYSYNSIEEHVARSNNYSTRVAEVAFESGKRASIWKMLLSPLFFFLKKYFLKLGFLDGYYGFVICVIGGYYNFLKYAKLRELYRQQSD